MNPADALAPRPERPLSALLTGLTPVLPEMDQAVTGVASDSRRVQPGDVFLACMGRRQSGADFAAAAVEAGALAVVYDAAAPAPSLPASVPALAVHRLDEHAGLIAARFYEYPARAMQVVGITGTNGKTSSSHFLAQALHTPARPCGVMGTLGNGVLGALQPSPLTTLDAVRVQETLARLRDHNVAYAVMEVSSHALDQGRVNEVDFYATVFTNLSRDHLDYHEDMAAYAAAKGRLFALPGLEAAVINSDDTYGRTLLTRLPGSVEAVSYGLDAAGSPVIGGQVASAGLNGMTLHLTTPWGERHLETSLLGEFNARNLLAVLATLLTLGFSLDEAVERLAGVRAVAGRMEPWRAPGHPLVVVDYAHSPEALAFALQALRTHCLGQLWCVFGCGGDRDRGKRPLMGEVAERNADRVVVTDDNPRQEDGAAIVADILAGMSRPDQSVVLRDRGQAIMCALRQAAATDVVLIAGKGHEDYQQVGVERLPFSDRDQVAALLGAGNA